STDDAIQARVVNELSKHLDITTVNTSARNDAIEIARSAQQQGFELVIGLGGDGTVNEIANGLLLDGPNPEGPLLAAIPGGNGNVFARNMGLSENPMEATAQILNAINNQKFQEIGVGRIATNNISRWFLFNAGIGLDAAVLAEMEVRRASGKAVSDFAYATLALRELFARTNRKHGSLSLVSDSGEVQRNAHFALIVNLAPWAYLGSKALNPLPAASHHTALDVYAPTSLSVSSVLRLASRAIAGKSAENDRNVIALTNQKQVHIQAEIPLWIQVDGDVIAQSTELTATHVPIALRVLAS
ncbi:MAG: diacylglycerol/lipid kinase family protein, partial [Candidatus Nanopelagicales bacterium]